MKTINLNGAWKFRWSDGQRGGMPHYIHSPGEDLTADLFGNKKLVSDDYDEIKWMDAAVPGEVHLDLLRNGIIEDPYIKDNIVKCRWVEEYLWFYRRVFDAGEAANNRKVFLVFEGLDYGAVIYLNGEEIGRHENSYYPCRLDVTGMLNEKGNVLIVRLESGLYSVAEKKVTDLYTATVSMDLLLHKRLWLRKPQSSTEWDWSQRLLNVGIFKAVHIDYSDSVIIDQTSIRTSTSPDLKSAKLEVRLFPGYLNQDLKDMQLNIKIDNTSYRFPVDNPGTGCISAEIALENPVLWYPRGYGSQKLYNIEVELSCSGNVLYRTARKTGLRYVEVDQSAHPVEGRYFNLLVNGIRVFAKGANFVPADMITAAITKERYRVLMERAVECNFNMLRVWGGGLYESDEFYSLCDEYGLLVWQDFISACGNIPFQDKKLADSIRQEFLHNVRRMSGHPSLVVWCGNNELDTPGVYKVFGNNSPDYELYHYVLPSILKEEDPEKYYQPSSPYSPDFIDYNSDTVGDQHPWSIGFADKDHRKYRDMVCRFPNEGGVMGPVSLPTLKSCLAGGQEYMHSFSWQLHDNMLENWGPGTSPDQSVSFWLGKDARAMALDEYVYYGGFVQGEGLTEYIDNFRRRKFDTGSAIFWMYNDCWPCTRSWTVVDYYLNRTPAFYAVKRAFSPVRVILAESRKNVAVYGVNDTLQPFAGTLRYGIFTCAGSYLMDQTSKVTLEPNKSLPAAVIPQELWKKAGEANAVPFAVLYDESGNIISCNRLINLKYHEMELFQAQIKVEKAKGALKFTSNVFTLGVCIDLDGCEALDDNMFDLYPGITRTIPWDEDKPIPEIKFILNKMLAK